MAETHRIVSERLPTTQYAQSMFPYQFDVFDIHDRLPNKSLRLWHATSSEYAQCGRDL